MVDLSVIIPVYNGELLLGRCLDSILNQTTQYKYEIILVDDGSTDDSVECMKIYQERLNKESARTQNQSDFCCSIVLYQQQNAGPAVARNKGVELAKGEFCAYLDADDYWLDGYIEKSVTFLKKHEDCVAVTVGQRYDKMGVEMKKHPLFITDEEARKRFEIDFKKEYEKSNGLTEAFEIEDFYRFWREWEHVGTCSTTIRRKVLLECGGQRSGLRICEDMEFWPYLASYGKWGMVPDVLYVSDGGAMVSLHGWAKYVKRFTNVPMYDEWFKRLRTRLTTEQIEMLKPVLNGVVCGHSRAMISGGDYRRAYENLAFVYDGLPVQYPVKIRRMGRLPYYAYAVLWRAYQYFKINKGVILKTLHIK